MANQQINTKSHAFPVTIYEDITGRWPCVSVDFYSLPVLCAAAHTLLPETGVRTRSGIATPLCASVSVPAAQSPHTFGDMAKLRIVIYESAHTQCRPVVYRCNIDLVYPFTTRSGTRKRRHSVSNKNKCVQLFWRQPVYQRRIDFQTSGRTPRAPHNIVPCYVPLRRCTVTPENLYRTNNRAHLVVPDSRSLFEGTRAMGRHYFEDLSLDVAEKVCRRSSVRQQGYRAREQVRDTCTAPGSQQDFGL
ncbi:hypothetical protein GOBAR_AA15205 [Gossypium barbadense]|uniref:Uncharacterized protein n=1 Tax=Gossypium barbadense TaxID=3634 RepID=A0A2P5XQ27_GOSBA|nr:hypothetical protein GOBAR_AA15205 [Gossypium barbadense]